MAYQKLFYFQYIKQRTTEVHLVEIWKDTTDVITAQEIKTNPPAFVDEMPELDNIFQVVRGMGFSMNLFSETDGQFFDSLYTTDPKQLMVKKYVDGLLYLLGYIDPEIIAEPYDYGKKYTVNVTGNDGLGLLDRFYFVQSDDSHYTGIKSKWDLLIIALNKIGLPWTEIRCKLSTTFADFSGDADKSILHESYIDCANFYDEDDNPLTLRQVVEAILAPYGAFLLCENGYVYICDIHTFAGSGTITFQRFTYSTEAYIADIGISVEKSVQTIGYLGTGQRKERSGGYNKQVVAYSPYPIKEITAGETIAGTDEFLVVPDNWSKKNESSSSDNWYNYKTLEQNSFWQEYSPATFEESYDYGGFEQDANIYLRYPRLTTNQRVASIKVNPYLTIAGATIDEWPLSVVFLKGLAFKITGEILVKTRLNPYIKRESEHRITSFMFAARLKVGNHYYSGDGGFSDVISEFIITTNVSGGTILADTFTAIGIHGDGVICPIGNYLTELDLSGIFEFEIYSYYAAIFQGLDSIREYATSVDEIWLKNIDISLVNLDGSEISDDDIEYTGILNKQFKNQGETVTLYCGTNSQFSDRGKILKYDGTNYSAIYEWTRNGQTYKIEELLLGSLSSNYRSGLITLQNMPLKCNFNRMNVITDSNIPGSKFMVKSVSFDAEKNKSDCTLIEIKQDELTIVKE